MAAGHIQDQWCQTEETVQRNRGFSVSLVQLGSVSRGRTVLKDFTQFCVHLPAWNAKKRTKYHDQTDNKIMPYLKQHLKC